MKKTTLSMFIVVLLAAGIAAAEGCWVYDTIDEVYLPDSDCDGWPDDVPKPEGFDDFFAGTQPEPEEPEPAAYSEPASAHPTLQYGSGTLEITYMASRNLAPGEQGAFFPIRIKNHGKTAEVIEISVKPITNWGTYRIEPGSIRSILPGNEETFYVFVKADFDAEPGTKDIHVNVLSDSDYQNIRLHANVISGARAADRKSQLEIGLIVLIAIIMIIGLALGIDRMRKSRKGERYSYY